MFSLSYLYNTLKIFLKYPSVTSKLVHGNQPAVRAVKELIKQKWAKKPVAIKSVNGYQIYLDVNDICGISPSIGVLGWYEPEYNRSNKFGNCW